MTGILIAILLLIINFVLIIVLGSINFLSVNEYKRRARSGDENSRQIYQMLLYGKQVNLLFWLVIGILNAISLNLLFNHAIVWIVVILFGFYSAYIFGYLSSKKYSFGLNLAKSISPLVSKILYLSQPVVGLIVPITKQSMIQQKIYEVDDLLDFLKEQQTSIHNRIDKDILVGAIESILFSEKVVKNSMTSIEDIASVSINEDIGPVLLEELHDANHSFFPVYKGKKNNYVGGLYLADIISVKHGGKISEHITKKLFYVHELSGLDDVISAIIKTNQNKFLVVNKNREIVGLITAQDVFKQITKVINPSELQQFDSIDDVVEQYNQKH